MREHLYRFLRINGQYTLDNIGSCLFGIETNSLKNQNLPLIKHLRQFFKINIKTLFILFLCESIESLIRNETYVI